MHFWKVVLLESFVWFGEITTYSCPSAPNTALFAYLSHFQMPTIKFLFLQSCSKFIFLLMLWCLFDLVVGFIFRSKQTILIFYTLNPLPYLFRTWLTIIQCIYFSSFSLAFIAIDRELTTWPANICLQIMARPCAIPSKSVLSQIMFCSWAIVTSVVC